MTCIIFDLDGTLTLPSQKLENSHHIEILNKVTEKYHSSICSGAPTQNILNQIGESLYSKFNMISGYNGNEIIYNKTNTRFINSNFSYKHFRSKISNPYISHWHQVLLDFVDNKCNVFQKVSMITLKPKETTTFFDKNGFVDIINENPKFGFKARYAGRNSIDIFKTGKEQILKQKDFQNQHVVFFCDQGINKYDIDKDLALKTHHIHVNSVDETYSILEKEFLKS